MATIATDTIGEAWLNVARTILSQGERSTYDGLPIHEVLMAHLIVASPQSFDEIIERYADRDRLAWMHANFSDHTVVAELGDADSYATRLHDYGRTGLDQLDWVVERLRADPTCRSASITTFQPLSDTSYIPCVSLLDFFLVNAALRLVVYAHSIDFGAKGYANLVELASIQHDVVKELGVDVGSLTMIVKSAHIYDSELAYMTSVLERSGD
ncbi:MAG TPA: thymidylate synthase [Acidimicrobiales bacterium]